MWALIWGLDWFGLVWFGLVLSVPPSGSHPQAPNTHTPPFQAPTPQPSPPTHTPHLQARVLEQLVEHDARLVAATHLDNQPHACGGWGRRVNAGAGRGVRGARRTAGSGRAAFFPKDRSTQLQPSPPLPQRPNPHPPCPVAVSKTDPPPLTRAVARPLPLPQRTNPARPLPSL